MITAEGNGTGILEQWSHTPATHIQHYLLFMLKLSFVTLCDLLKKKKKNLLENRWSNKSSIFNMSLIKIGL